MPYADAEYEYFEQRQLPARPIQPGLQPLLQHTDYKRPQDETLYAEPILINHNVNISNPLGNLHYPHFQEVMFKSYLQSGKLAVK